MTEKESFDDRVKEAVKYLWDDGEHYYFVIDDTHIVLEVEETGVDVNDVRDVLPDAIISYKYVNWYNALFFIKEGK